MKNISLAFCVLAATLAIPSAALADSWNFTVSGPGISGSGEITATPVGGGVFDITGVNGSFTDSVAGINGAITGLGPGSYDSAHPTITDYDVIPGGATYFWQTDNLLYPAGNAPGVDGGAPGGDLDNYGLFFYVAGGFEVNIWGDGTGEPYSVGDSTVANGPALDLSYSADSFTLSQTPEPDSFYLLGTGLLGLALVAFRKTRRAASVMQL